MDIATFKPGMQESVGTFFEKCFSAVGIPYSPLDRHADIADVENHYMQSGIFWCLFDEQTLIGTVALRTIDYENKVVELKRLSPIPRPRQDVLCLGLNYTAHAAEAAGFSKEAFGKKSSAPVFFSKRVNESQGSGAPIPSHADITEKLDFENELAVVIGRDAKNVPEEEAGDYVFGYTVLNDVSARDLQTAHVQWHFGKSLDGFTPMGPCLVTADEFAFPPDLRIYTDVNGERRQDSRTSLLIHGIPEIVSTLSRGMTLKAGTIIATGTPKGVGMGEETPRFLKPGDVVACSIEGIGTLVNPVE